MGTTVLAVVQGPPPELSGDTKFRDGMRTGLPIIIAMSLVLLLGTLYSTAARHDDPRCGGDVGGGEVSEQRSLVRMHNASATELGRVPSLSFPRFRDAVLNGVTNGMRVAALFGEVGESSRQVRLFVVLADSVHGQLQLAQTHVEDDRFESLTPDCPQLHLFEREIAEQFGVRPEGHPWFKPVRFHASWRPGHDAWHRAENEKPVPGVMDFYRVDGEEIHEVAVGPVHAGVIEPGHFRFQCHGEHVFHLEISLGYQHRGVERALCGGPDNRSIHYMETLAGDTTVGHATAYAQVIEALAGCRVPIRGQILRGVALELERLANHTGDLGALAGDVGYLPTASYCGRLRGDFLNITALMCGSRFGRGMIRPGGVGFDVDGLRIEQILQRLELAYRDVTSAVNLLWDSPSVQSRFEDTGAISPQIAEQLGLVGPAARACGLVLRRSRKTFRPAFSSFRRYRCRRGTRATSSHARSCAGWRFRTR